MVMGYVWDSSKLLLDEDSALAHKIDSLSLVVANSNLPENLIKRIWEYASMHICADGGSNRLYDQLPKYRSTLIPDFIKGDLDSAREEVLSYYRSKGTQVIQDPNQDTTDLEKSFELIEKTCLSKEYSTYLSNERYTVVVVGVFGLSVSHELANFNSMIKWSKIWNVVFISEFNGLWALPSGKNTIKTKVGTKCSLIPLGAPCEKITTHGLKWNLGGDLSSMSFGGLVSTSNVTLSDTVFIENSHPLLWIVDFNE